MFRFLLALFAVIAVAVPVRAQQTTPHPLPIGGLFGGQRPVDPNNPDRAEQELTFETDLLAGYDQIEGTQLIANGFNQAGAIRSTAADLRHRWGNSTNFLDSMASGHMTFADVGLQQQTTGLAHVTGAFALGKRAGVNLQVDAAYQPTYLFTAFGSPASGASDATVIEGTSPDTQLTEGFTEERWLAAGGTARLHRNWSPRQVTELSYGATRRTMVRNPENYSRATTGGFTHDWSFRERAGVLIGYQYDEYRQLATDDAEQPTQSHRATMGLRFTKRWPRGKTLTTTFNGGATQTQRLAESETSPGYRFTVPSVRVGLQSQMSSRWAWSVDASRDVTVLEGLSPQPFLTDVASVSVRGRLGFAELVSSGAYSQGVANDNSTGRFQATIGTVSISYPIGRRFSFATSYAFYDHTLFDLRELEAYLPSHQRRHSVRAGVHLWLPLFGSF